MATLKISEECFAQLEFLKEIYELPSIGEVAEALIEDSYMQQQQQLPGSGVTDVKAVVEAILDPNISIAEVVVTLGERKEVPPLTYEELLACVPSDPVIKDAKDDNLTRKAVEIVYGRLGTVDWGTPVARSLVESVRAKLGAETPIDSNKEPN